MLDLGEGASFSTGGASEGCCAFKVVMVGALLLGPGVGLGGEPGSESAEAAEADSVSAALAAAAVAAAVSPSAAVALRVVKSTVTLRMDSVLSDAGRAGALAVAGLFGPDNNSGTINTNSTTRIVAPTTRSLTLRSMKTLRPFSSSARRASIFGKRTRRQKSLRLQPIESGPYDVE
jgi:hypothetical protein